MSDFCFRLKDSILFQPTATRLVHIFTMMLNRSMRLLTLLIVFAVVAVGASAPLGEKKAALRTLCKFCVCPASMHTCAALMQNLT